MKAIDIKGQLCSASLFFVGGNEGYKVAAI